jgi:hypothetical protein
MRLKLLLVVTVFAAGLGASYALAGNGGGNSQGDHNCREVHVNGTVGPQTYTVTLTRDSKRLNLKAGATVVVTIGGTGQTVRFNGEGCSSTTGTTTATTFNEAEIHAFTPKVHSTTGGTTTQKSDDDH